MSKSDKIYGLIVAVLACFIAGMVEAQNAMTFDTSKAGLLATSTTGDVAAATAGQTLGTTLPYVSTADQAGITSTLVNATGLSFPIAANGRAAFTAIVTVTTTLASGVQFQFTMPSGTTYSTMTGLLSTSGSPVALGTGNAISTLLTSVAFTAGTPATWLCWGSVENGATAGTVQLQVAAGTLALGTLTVKRDSRINVTSF